MFAVMKAFIRLCAALVQLALPVSLIPTAGMAGGAGPGDVAQIDVLPGWRLPDGSHMAAIRIRLADGWKTYWRAPGDAGLPPGFDWQGSRNLQAVAFQWPVPDVFVSNGLRTIGYKHQLVLPMRLTPRREGRAITLKGRISLGVCRDICVPMQARISARLPADVQTRDPVIERALNRRPDTAAEAGLRRAVCEVEPIADGLRLTARLDLPQVGPDEIAVIETADATVWVSEAMVSRQGRVLTAQSDLVPPAGAAFLLNRSDIRITVIGSGRAVDISGCDAGS